MRLFDSETATDVFLPANYTLTQVRWLLDAESIETDIVRQWYVEDIGTITLNLISARHVKNATTYLFVVSVSEELGHQGVNIPSICRDPLVDYKRYIDPVIIDDIAAEWAVLTKLRRRLRKGDFRTRKRIAASERAIRQHDSLLHFSWSSTQFVNAVRRDVTRSHGRDGIG